MQGMKETTRTGIPLIRMEGSRVPHNLDNCNRCMCPGCNVQANSQCVEEKKASLGTVPLSVLPSAGEMPGQYCATGTAGCEDIDIDQACSCFYCSVYEENNLEAGEPTCYFCSQGTSH